MRKTWLGAIVMVLAVGTTAVRADTETTAPEPTTVLSAAEVLFNLLNGATVEQRLRVSRFLTNKYPWLNKELLGLLSEHDPEFLAKMTPQLEHLVKTKYQRLPGLIHSKLAQAPAVQTAVEEMIGENYPQLIADLRALQESEDMRKRAAELIQQKYPDLLADVLATITRRFPSLLQELQHEVIAAFPGLLADAARIVITSYPKLSQKILLLTISKYPDLLPTVLVILTQPPPAAEPNEPVGPPPPPEPTTP